MKAQLRFMTSEELHKLSYGEVLLPDTYNFRETPPSPVPTGLMCQMIFGPVVDYCCACGALEGKHNKSARCHVCGVDVVSSSVRSERMGHITLPYPCIHPLATKWLSIVLGISLQKLEKVLYGKSSIAFIAGGGNLVLNGMVGSVEVEDTVPNTILEGSSFAISQIIDRLDLDATLELMSGKQALLLSHMKAGQQYILRNILVSPPDYRPLISVDGLWVTSAINQLYADVLNSANRINRMKMFKPPALIVLVEAIQLQKCIDRLFIDGITKKGVNYKSLLMSLSKKTGLFRHNLLGKRVDYSGRSVITAGPELKLDEAGIPILMAKNLFIPFIIHYFRKKGFKYKAIRKLIKNDDYQVTECLEGICANHRIILNRQPTLHKLGIRAFKIILHSGKSIKLASLVCNAYNADHDGDTMAAHIPISKESLHDVKVLMDGTKHLLNSSDGSVAVAPSHEMLIGLYKLTDLVKKESIRKFRSLSSLEYLQQINEVKVNEEILFFNGEKYVITCLGRLWLEAILKVPVIEAITKRTVKTLLSKAYDVLGREQFAEAINELKDLGFEWSTKLNFSLCIGDFHIPSTRDAKFKEANDYAKLMEASKVSEVEKHSKIVRKWMGTIKEVQNDFLEESGKDNSLVLMLNTGARASMSQVSQLTVAKGMLADLSGEIIRNPIERNHTEGLDMIGYFRAMSGSRKGLADAKFSTPKTGYLTRRLVMAARDFYIVASDCHTNEGLWVSNSDVKGRSVIEVQGDWSKIRSPIFCEEKGGICKKCYGTDLATRKRVVKNTAIGVIAGQSLSEPTTQMTLRTFHTSGAAELGDSPTVIKAKRAGQVKVTVGQTVTTVRVNADAYYAHNIAEVVVKNGQEVEIGEPLVSYINAVRQEDVTNKVPILELYFEVRTPKIEAVVARIDGHIRILTTDDDSTIRLFIDDVCQGEVLDQSIFVYDGELVRKGQFLSYGEANLRKLWNATHDLELLAIVFVHRLLVLYREEGVAINGIHLEVIFRALTEVVRKDDNSLGLRMFDEGAIMLLGSNQLGGTHPSWLKAAAFGWTKFNLSTAAAMNRVTYDLPTERIITGERLPRRSQDFA